MNFNTEGRNYDEEVEESENEEGCVRARLFYGTCRSIASKSAIDPISGMMPR